MAIEISEENEVKNNKLHLDEQRNGFEYFVQKKVESEKKNIHHRSRIAVVSSVYMEHPLEIEAPKKTMD